MHVYPMSSPSEKSGVYLLRNRVAKVYYVGKSLNLRRRWSEWKTCFATGIGFRNRMFATVSVDPADWEFVIAHLCPANKLGRIENEVIAELRKRKTIIVLNNHDLVHNPQAQTASKSQIFNNDRHITSVEAARIIGCRVDTLRKRLRRLRQHGHSGRFDVEDLT